MFQNHAGLNPVASQVGQSRFHAVIHLVDKITQCKRFAAFHAAPAQISSAVLQGQGPPA
jgi:hypothetical protein